MIGSIQLLLSLKARRRSLPLFIVFLTSTVYVSTSSYITISKFFAFRDTALDLGVFEQGLWSTITFGLLFWNTPELTSHFAVHFDPVLFLLLPFYVFYPSPSFVLFLQSFLIGFSAIPLFLFAKNELKSDSLSFLTVIIYLLYPPLHGVNWFDFHPECLLPLLLFTAFYYFQRNSFFKATFFFLLSMMCKEIVSIFIFLISFCLLTETLLRHNNLKFKELARSENAKFSLANMFMSAVWFIVSSRVPFLFNPLSPTGFYYPWFHMFSPLKNLGVSWYIFNLVYLRQMLQSIFRSSPPIVSIMLWLQINQFSILNLGVNIVLNPVYTFQVMTSPISYKVFFLEGVLGPLLLLPLLSPVFMLPSIPWIVFALTAASSTYFTPVGYQHIAMIIPILFISFVYGLKRLLTSLDGFVKIIIRFEELLMVKFGPFLLGYLPKFLIKLYSSYRRRINYPSVILVFLVIILLFNSFAFFISMSPFSHSLGETEVTLNKQVLLAVSRLIPPGSTVATQNDIFPHLSHNLWAFPDYYDFMQYDYILVKTRSPWYSKYLLVTTKVILNSTPLSDVVQNLIERGTYGVLISIDDIILLKRNYSGSPLINFTGYLGESAGIYEQIIYVITHLANSSKSTS